MPPRKIRARASRPGAPKLNKAKAAVPIAAFLCAVALFAQSALRIAAGGSIENELLSLGFPLLYSAVGAAKEEPAPSETAELPSPIRINRADIDAGVSESVRVELLRVEEEGTLGAPVDLSGSAPRILIYHTHTTEAYFPTSEHTYAETSAWRTKDNTCNIVTVGERLTELLRGRYGISVLHDVTDHEPPKLATSYSRSVVTMEKYREEYPSITMFIDVHRDAYGNNPKEATDFITIDGKEVARLMFVVGTGRGPRGRASARCRISLRTTHLQSASRNTSPGSTSGLCATSASNPGATTSTFPTSACSWRSATTPTRWSRRSMLWSTWRKRLRRWAGSALRWRRAARPRKPPCRSRRKLCLREHVHAH